MAYVKIEPSGCEIRKGWIKLRLSFFLEPSDPRYNEYYLYILDTSSPEVRAGYRGGYINSEPINQADYDKWFNGLPRIWMNTEFHNHFVYVDTNTTASQLQQLANLWLTEFFDGWKQGKNGIEVWESKPRDEIIPRILTQGQLNTATTKLNQLKAVVI